MKSKPIYVELEMNTDMEKLWEHTQNPALHQQWDLRFSEITYLPRSDEDSPQRFTYKTRIGFGMTIEGTGVTKSRIQSAKRISTLSFASEQGLSLISHGSGFWKYQEHEQGITFLTQYNYDTRFGLLGRWFDRLLFRPLFGYATAWSFDALRLWLEKQIAPAVSMQRALLHSFSVLMLVLLWLYQGIVPKLLFPEAGELQVMQAMGWFAGQEQLMLIMLGLLETGLGIVTLLWHRRSILYTAQIGLLLMLAAGALIGSPELLQQPFNPVTLSGSMIAFSLIAKWSLRDLPDASRCIRRVSHHAQGGNANEIYIRRSFRG